MAEFRERCQFDQAIILTSLDFTSHHISQILPISQNIANGGIGFAAFACLGQRSPRSNGKKNR